MDQPSLGMPDRDYYLNEDTRDKTEPGYRQFMINFMTMIAGSSANATKIANVSDEVRRLCVIPISAAMCEM